MWALIVRTIVKNLKIGDVIASDIMYGGGSRPLVVRDSVVTPYIKERLEELEIMSVNIINNDYKPKNPEIIKKEKDKKIFKKQYSQNVDAVKDVFNDIIKGEKINLNKIDNISRGLIKNTSDIATTVESINEINEIDDDTYAHSINVSLYSMMLAKWMNLDDSEVKSIVKSGVLHDIGKGKLDKDILNKPGKLTDDEFNHIKKHTIYGYDICKPMIFLSDEIKNGVLMHHEKSDGTGYPLGIGTGKISFYAKIIGICDVYDALNSKRVYKEKQTPFDTFNQMIEIGKGKLDEEMLILFLKNIASLYVGSKVKTNMDQVGEIIHVPSENISRPIIKIDGTYYDLSKTETIKIDEML